MKKLFFILQVICISLLSAMPAMAAMAGLTPVTIVETWEGGEVQFAVTVEEGYQLAGFAVRNDFATDAWMDAGMGSYEESRMEVWCATVLEHAGTGHASTMGTANGWRYVDEWDYGEEGEEPTPAHYATMDFLAEWEGELGDRAFGYFYNVNEFGEEEPVYFDPGTYDIFLGLTTAPRSPIIVSLYNSDTEEYELFEAETTTVPLPSAVWMLATGVVGLIGIRRKQ